MATYVYELLPAFTPIQFSPYADVIDFTGSGLSAAQVFTTDEDDDGELSLFTDERLLFLLLPDDFGPLRLSPENFLTDSGAVIIGDGTSAWRDDDLAQTITGTAGGDWIAALGGNDTIDAGAGNDAIYLFTGESDNLGADVINGGADTDTLFLMHELDEEDSHVATVNLTSGSASFGINGSATLSGIENVIGSQSRDSITGSAADNFLAGRDEEDTLIGNAGNDTLVGGEGNDSLSGGDGNDLLRGQAGRDTILGGAGNDTIAGTGLRFDTTIDGGAGTDTIVVPMPFNLAGSNIVNVENITITGPAGNEIGIGLLGDLPESLLLVQTSAQSGTLASNFGFLGDLMLVNAAELIGTSGANRMTGNAGNNGLEGMQGNDTLDGGAGRDLARYANSPSAVGVVVNLTDTVQGGLQSMTASDGFGGIDTLISIEGARGGAGNDTFFGGSGNDHFNAGGGNDSILGGAGDDTIRGREGTDTMDGGLGNDLLSFSQVNGGVNFNLQSGAITNDGHGNIETATNFEDAAGWFFDDTLIGSSGANRLFGNFGSDALTGAGGNDFLDGGRGNDEARYNDPDGAGAAIVANLSTGTVTRGAETDTLVSIEAIVGGAGNDSITGQDGHFVVTGSSYVDAFERYEGGAGNDTINGGGSNDGFVDIASYRFDIAGVAVNLGPDSVDLSSQTGSVFTGTLNAGSALDGSGGIDTLFHIDYAWGSAFADYLRGGSSSTNYLGNLFEAFNGGAGNDTIDGGDGLDRVDYSFNNGSQHAAVNLSDSVQGGLAAHTATDGLGGTDTLINIEGARGGAGNDTFFGGGGDEFFSPQGGNDSVNGGLGFDTIQYQFSRGGVVVDFTTGTANDGFGGIDTLTGIEGASGSDFNDTFVDLEGQNNSYDGRLGVRFDPSWTQSSLGGGIGVHQDQVSFFGQENGVNVDLRFNSATDGLGGADTLVGIEVITGTAHDDTIIGSNTADEIEGLFTDRTERFVGGSGNDLIDGGDGEDGDFDSVQYFVEVVVNLGPSFQFYSGDAFSGFVYGGTVDENGAFNSTPGTVDTISDIDGVITGGGNDLIFGGSDSRYLNHSELETFSPGGGNDTVVGLDGFDYVSYQGRTDAAVNVNLENGAPGFNFFYSSGGFGGGGFNDRGTATFFNSSGVATGEVDLLIGIDGVRGTQLNDTLRGGQGNFELGNRQVFEGNKGDDIIDGWDAEGITSYRSSPTGVYVDLGRGFALDGWGTIDFLNQLSGARGSDFDDTLIGGSSRNLGSERAFEFFDGGAGNDIIDGGDDADIPRITGEADHDFDVLEYRNAPTGAVVNLATGTAQDGFGGTDTFTGIEGVRGSAFADTLTGSDQALEFFSGGAGNDVINGGEGIDLLDFDFHPAGVVVNLGSTDIQSHEGDTVAAGTVLDSWGDIDTVTGIEWVTGSPHDDILVGNDLDNLIEGLEGDDYLIGNGGNDTLIGHDDGTDIVDFGNSTMGVVVDLSRGTAEDGLGGTDTLIEIYGAFGGAFADLLTGNHHDNYLMGRGGDDTLRGGDGNDWAVYDEEGAAVNVDLGAGTATDGEGGTDTLESIEAVIGSEFADTLTGGAGNDSFDGRDGADTIDGGAGFDAVTYNESFNAVVVNLSGDDADIAFLVSIGQVGEGSQVDLLYSGETVVGGTALDGILVFNGEGFEPGPADHLISIEGVRGSRFGDLIIGPDVAANSRFIVAPNGGDDTIIAGDGPGQTILTFQPIDPDSNDFSNEWSIFADLTQDEFEGPGQIFLMGADGAESIVTFSGVDGLIGGRMWDSLFGDDQANYFRGGQGNDTINGADTLTPDAGDVNDMASFRDAFHPVVATIGGQQVITYVNADGENIGQVTVFGGTAIDGSVDGGEGPLYIDTLINIEHLEGGNYNDTLAGNGLNNRLIGLDGDDEFRPGGGNDFLDGGAGNDRVSYGGNSTAVIVDLGDGIAIKNGTTTDELIIDGAVFKRAFDATKPIVGSWEFDPDDLSGHIGVVTFASDGTFIFSHIGSHLGGLDGIERGTYAFNAATGGFTATVELDQLPPEGFDDFAFTSFEIVGDTLLLHRDGGEGFTRELERVVDQSNGLTGGWYLNNPAAPGDAGGPVALTFFSDGTYIIGQDGDSVADPSGQDGLEKGTFTFTGGTLDVVSSIDTNGEWGLTANFSEGVGNASYSASLSGSDRLVSIEQISGSIHNDRLTGSDDQEYTGSYLDGFESFFGNAGNDTIDGGGSTNGQFDILSFGSATVGISANLGTGVATGQGSDTFKNIDMVIGGSAADTLTGGSESRSYSGHLFESFRGGAGNDIINGLDGEDRVDYSFATQGVVVTLGNGTAAGTAKDGQGGTDTLRNVEQVRGSVFADTLNGGGTHNAGTGYDFEVFEGLEGNDKIDGKDGHDSAQYTRSPERIIANLGEGAITVDGITVQSGKVFDGFGTTDTLTNIEQITGSDHDDYVRGSDNDVREIFRGNGGNDTLIGGDGEDQLSYVSSAAGVTVDFNTGTAQDGLGGIDSFSGMDAVRGSVGNDTFLGSAGNERFFGLNGVDVIAGGEGIDILDFSLDEMFGGGAGVQVNLGGGFAIDGFGNFETFTSIEGVTATRFNDTITGSGVDEDLEGGAGDDSINGAGGNDRLVFTNAQAAVTVDFALGTVQDGTDKNLALAGIQQGTDSFSNMEGAVGTAFHDTFVLASGEENIDGGDGSDTVVTGFTFSLATGGTNVENLTLTGSAAANGTGNDLANVINGNDGNNVLQGGAGNDTLQGGAGNDTLTGGAGVDRLVGGAGDDKYVLESPADVVVEAANGGFDEVTLSADFSAVSIGELTYTAGAGVEGVISLAAGPLILNGNALSNFLVGFNSNDTLVGNDGHDTLDGQGGSNDLRGGLGNDVYRVRTLGDLVTEGANGGIDTVQSQITGAGYLLGNNVENLVLLEAIEIQIGRGNKLNNRITGNDFDNQLFGDLGNDTLEGMGGADRLFGGAGSDTYILRAGDTVIEVGGSTADRALATISLDLTNIAGIENAVAEEGTSDIDITGNKLANKIDGNDGSNVLNGGAGKDTLNGGAGDDVYVLNGSLDTIIDTGGGIDGIQADFSISLVGLPTIENITLLGTGNLNGTGNGLQNVILGYLDEDGSEFDDQSGNNFLSGLGNSDTLDGGAGNDTLDGGAGTDSMIGGAGDDVYIVDNAGDRVDEGASGAGTDEVRSTVSIDLSSAAGVVVTNTAIENVTLGGTGNVNAIGNDFANVLTGNAGKNSITGGMGDDTVIGAGGNDTLAGGDGNDVLSYASSAAAVNVNLLTGIAKDGVDTNKAVAGVQSGTDTISGFEHVIGSKFGDTLTSGEGVATLAGGLGNDTYILDADGHTITELAGQGIDTLVVSYSETLVGTEVENITLATGAGAIDATGNAAANKLTGNASDNVLNGMGGKDTMAGGGGNDTYHVDMVGETVTEASNAGTDTVRSTITYVLGANLENLVLEGSDNINGTGNTAGNSLTGNDGDNVLDGKTGADAMAGGDGNDSYIVDNLGDTVTESADEGIDQVTSSVSFTLGADVDHLTLTGTAATGTGNALANQITGNAAANTLTGGGGDDTLNGMGGADRLVGGDGGDLYFVDNLGDVVSETGEGGTDEVRSTVQLSLAGSLIENGTLLGSASVNIIGSADNNILTGNSGNNFLDGNGGNDTLIGGAGNDIYEIDNTSDVVEELEGGGIDTIRSDQSFNLTTHGANVENLQLGNSGATSATGNELNNKLLGNTFGNVLDGMAGVDTMIGGDGDDEYHVDDLGDVVIDGTPTPNFPGNGGGVLPGGHDHVISSVSFTLGADLDDLTLTGSAVSGTGNALANLITGNAGDNVIDGKGEADEMVGGDGNDSYFVDNAGDVVTEAADEGIDRITSSIDFDLSTDGANVEKLTLATGAVTGTGNDLDNEITGNAAANTLDGGIGDDTISGGASSDSMLGGEGNDQLSYASAAAAVTVSLAAGTASGGAGSDTFDGFEAVLGSNFNDSLTGGDGNDTLDGAGGADTLVGGAGDNVFVVDNLNDRVFAAGGLSVDEVRSTVTINLQAAGVVELGSVNNISHITLLGSAAINATGNSRDNEITGNDGDNVLDGLLGNDTLDGGDGFDIVDYSSFVSAVTVDLSAGTGEAEEPSADAETDQINNIEGIYGGGDGDTLTGDDGDNLIRGGAGSDTLAGGLGNDTLDYSTAPGGVVVDLAGGTANDGDGGTDQISGFEAVRGGAFGDSVTGTGISETLDGGGGADTLTGGGGGDTFFVDNAGDSVTGGAGNDTVFATVTHTLSAAVERLYLLGTAAINGIGNALDNLITGNSAANTLTGLGGNDTLDGAGGADTLIGGDGNDVYVADSALDRVRETGTGVDEVQSSVTVSLSAAGVVEAGSLANIENVTLLGSANINATGNAQANTLAGNTGNNVLDGKAGADEMAGGDGNDTYVVDNVGDTVFEEGGGGTDLVLSSVDWILDPEVENLTLTGTAVIDGTGNELGNVITGNAKNNVLDGAGGADTLAGGTGNDTYVVDQLGDVLSDTGGIDTVQSALSWTLAAAFEHLVLTDGEGWTGTGNALANSITGNTGNDTLIGLGGNDTLDGGAGADVLQGGAGADTYVVDNAGDDVQDTVAGALGGADTVRASISYDLTLAGRENLEHVTLTGGDPINATGNALRNRLEGNGGNNILDGKGGIDTLVGGNGDDSYFVDSVSDVVTELGGLAGGTDTLNANFSIAALNVHLENINLLGAGNLNATGNASENEINGNGGHNLLKGLAGDDVLYGAEGNDTLDGGTGADELTGSLGDDTFIFDDAGDEAIEETGEGTDTVKSSVDTTLGANIENLELTGTGAIDGTGNAENNLITGNAGANALSGGDGHDTLSGGGGNDALTGGIGNDVFLFDIADGLVDGGAGEDSIVVTGALPGTTRTLDLATISDARWESIERIDISGSVGVNNTLKLTLNDLKEVLDVDEDGILTIDGNVFDAVVSENQDWAFQGVASIGEKFYFVYTDPTLEFTLQINQDMTQVIS